MKKTDYVPQNDPNKETPPEQIKKSSGGLYSRVKMSVKTADIIVLCGSIALIAAIIIVSSNGGFTLSFDSKGGSYIPSQKLMYGETAEGTPKPTREGYEFTGWYSDPDCLNEWDLDSDEVTGSITLYAGWESEE